EGARTGSTPAPPPETKNARDEKDARARTAGDAKERDDDEDLKDRIEQEPFVRIGLATTARSVTISTTGRLLDTSNPSAPPAPFETARVRIEPRSMPPLTPTPPPTTEDDALTDMAAEETAAPGNVAGVNPATARRGPPNSHASNGTNNANGINAPKANDGARGSVRLVSRVSEVTRGAVLYAPGATTPLADVRAPVVFASDDEAQHPVRYNEKPYRGRLEVFANTRGALTVVNVVPLEDYLRGVVPNELSPGAFPEIEALKAQAVAARTYALANLRRFQSAGFDLLPTTRSQVYGGRATEHPLTDRAVSETRGRVATYKGEAINAVYTSTCGGRTEHAELIFGGNAAPYLRARECAYESGEPFAPHTVRTSRPLFDIKLAEHASSARDAALLAAHGLLPAAPARLDDEWLAAPATAGEVTALLQSVTTLTRQPFFSVPNEATRPPAFATLLSKALDGESRGDVLLNSIDIAYQLSFKDADEIPDRHRADVAALLREGHLSLYPDATLRPRQPMTRARVLRAVAHAFEARGLFQLQKATARIDSSGALIFRLPGKSGDKTPTFMPGGGFVFRAFGDALYQVREVSLVGGEPLVFHTDHQGQVNYLEVRPAPNGAAPDRFSAYSNWAETLSPSAAQSRLGRAAAGVGTLLDLRVRARGASRRVIDLEVVGTVGTAHVRGGRVRSALGLREQLFVIDRLHDEEGRVKTFVITGRGWGHGVGLCQVGAFGMARAGMSHEKILKAYYTDIKLARLY
ncbi:MAG TPA: SpoIID/LytB domain-containing protein, partial [Pyrinomonadaceae bacterium]|nr:SpoIID/LytB domain-containing protein [Pyrinomonadaceae bacterium]